MKVLIAVDDSPCSAQAITSVAENCWPEHSQFSIITVLEPVYAQYAYAGIYEIDSMYDAQKQLAQICQNFLDEKVAQLKSALKTDQISSKVIEGSVADTILDEASNWGADLIVLGSHGRKGIQRFLLGSVAEKVASHAPCSVEIVKTKTAASKTGEKSSESDQQISAKSTK